MRTVAWLSVVVAGLMLASCMKRTEEEAARSRGKKEAVTLPPRPNLTPKRSPEKFQDGVWSVDGVMRHARELLGRDVVVRGNVAEIVRCAPDEKPCKKVLHLVLVDDLSNQKRKLPVIGEPPELILSGYDERSTQTISGKLGMWSPDGRMVSLDGLVVIKPPPSGPPPAEGGAAVK